MSYISSLLVLTLFCIVSVAASAIDTCYTSVQFVPAACKGGTIMRDDYNRQGDSCRHIQCGDSVSTSSVEIKACDKPNTTAPLYFEMYKVSQSGTKQLELCLYTACISDGGYAKSSAYPICTAGTCTSSAEVCDQKDNDCDGQVDEGLSCGLVCVVSVRDVPVTCDGGSVTKDEYNGQCRVVLCTNGSSSLQALACNKPTGASPEYFEVYEQNQTGTAVSQVCIGQSCIGTNGFAKSGAFPYCTQAGPRPDLVITAVQAPATAIEGQAVPVNVTVMNQGQATAPKPHSIHVVVSTDATITAADTFAEVVVVPVLLLPGESFSATVWVGLSGVTGTRTIGAIADGTLAVSESSESNNARSGNTITLLPFPESNSTLLAGSTVYMKLDGTLTDERGHVVQTRSQGDFVAGKIGNGVQFNSAAGNPMLYSNTYIQGNGGKASIGFWAKFTGAAQGALYQWPARYQLVRLASGRVELRSYEQRATTIHRVQSAVIPVGEWHYYTLVIDRDYPAKTARLFVDGVFVGSVKDPDEFAHGTMYWGAGDGNYFAANGVDVVLDEIGVWNRLLSPLEVSQLYAGGAGNAYPFGISTSPNGTCYAQMQSIPATCSVGSVTQDALAGDTCRYITCSTTIGSTQVKVCNKPGKYDPQYFEMYVVNKTGSPVSACLAGVCAGVAPFARSSIYPVCQ